MKINSLVLSLFLAQSQAVVVRKNTDRISNESRDIINGAVNDVLHITQGPDAGDQITHSEEHHHHFSAPEVVVHPAPVYQETHHHHHHFGGSVHTVESRVVPVTRYVPVPAPVTRSVTVEQPAAVITNSVSTTPNTIPTVVTVPADGPAHSSVVRAVADANMKTAQQTINE